MSDYRPQYHFTPPQNWMNDPNGLVYHDGVYHLFYQHNPYAKQWGHMSWGHAVSKDLLTWEHLPIAIMEEPEAGYTIFSGSAVIHDNQMLAFYTADYREDGKGLLETIHCAVSEDGGTTFTQSPQNPLIDVGNPKFGDPKVFWDDERERWVMVNICGEGQGHVKIYGSDDLTTWTLLSEFLDDGRTPGTWECPDLFPLAVDDDLTNIKWVMKVNYLPVGAKLFTTRYFLGDFDGTAFTCDKVVGEGLTSDDGAIYAEVTYNAVPDGRRILIGWLRQEAVAERPWTGAQAIPRELYLKSTTDGIALCQRPLRELAGWRSDVTGDVTDLRGIGNRAIEIELEWPDGKDCEAILKTTQGDVRVGIDVTKAELYCEHASRGRIASVLPSHSPGNKIRIFLDEALIEVFAGDETAVTGYLPFGAEYEFLDTGDATDVHVWSLVNLS